MLPNMIKQVLVGLLLLIGGCGSTPVDIVGKINLAHSTLAPYYDYTKRDRVVLNIWFCPSKVNIEARSQTELSRFFIKEKMEKIATAECLKADTNIDTATFSIQGIPSGRYTACVNLITVNPDSHELEGALWFENLNIKKSQELTFRIDDAFSY